MAKTPYVAQALKSLRDAFKWNKAHGHDAKAARIHRAIRDVQDDMAPPVHIVWPGVRAAREQSSAGGFPGTPGPNPGADWCLKMVRLCYGIGPSATDAIGAWNAAKKKHRATNAITGSIPRGYPIFWSGGSDGHGHVAISAGEGLCWSTDIRRDGFFDRVAITRIHDQWGLTLLGWTEDLNGQPVPAEKEIR